MAGAVTSGIGAAKPRDQSRPCYKAVAVAGKRADRIAARLALAAIESLTNGAGG